MRAAGGGSACPRTKPAIYKTVNGKVIVEDELLNFIVVKMKTLSHDEIVLLATNNFSSEWIEESKRLLFDVCPDTTLRCIGHKGPQKDVNNIKACLKVLNECGENIPRFVSHYLDELPPVGFGHMDASALLSRMEQLNQEVSGLRRALQIQAEVGENLGTIVATMDRRVTAVETHCTSGYDIGADGTACEGMSGRAGPDRQEELTTSPAGKSCHLGLDTEIASSSCGGVKGLEGSAQQQELLDVAVTSPRSQIQSSQWSVVVKEGRKKSGSLKVTVPRKSHNKQSHLKRGQRNVGIIGTGTESNIGVVKTKLVNVFATRFSPTLDADTLRGYLSEKLENGIVTCRKIETVHSRYGSFHITAECNNVADIYNPKLWPDGTYVRRYYEARGSKVLGNERGGELDCHGTLVAPHGSQSAVAAM